MQDLIFATGNRHKVDEIAALLPARFTLKSMRDLGFTEEIDEPFDTLAENAAEKCRVVAAALGKDVFAEDSGLFVNQLNGQPGVRSARYAGEPADDERNIDKLLQAVDFNGDTGAYFQTVIALFFEGQMHYFTGRCDGRLIDRRVGDRGFGYDPVFVPEGSERTFAEMDKAGKAVFSHRAKAVAQLVNFLTSKA